MHRNKREEGTRARLQKKFAEQQNQKLQEDLLQATMTIYDHCISIEKVTSNINLAKSTIDKLKNQKDIDNTQTIAFWENYQNHHDNIYKELTIKGSIKGSTIEVKIPSNFTTTPNFQNMAKRAKKEVENQNKSRQVENQKELEFYSHKEREKAREDFTNLLEELKLEELKKDLVGLDSTQ